MKKNNNRNGMIKGRLRKIGVVPVRVTVKPGEKQFAHTGRAWQWEGENYASLEDIYHLPKVWKMLKEANL